jgi:DNA modification methylase/superfamily II DNA or RNA helicase
MTDYNDFLENKHLLVQDSGFAIDDTDINPILFEFQRDLTRWAVAKGTAAIFADTGLGKTFMQLEWARLLDAPVLLVAPLAVAHQTVDEAAKLGIDLNYRRHQDDVDSLLTITNYEMVSRFDPDRFVGVVLDESSILKNYTGKIRTQLVEQFASTEYKLCCTATPAPNDIAEIANHAEFLGIMSRVEMLAAFFVHDDKGWRLKGHATNPFYRWMASWGMAVKRPSDLGYSDDGFDLPPLNVLEIIVDSEWKPDGQLFASHLKGITERASVRKATLNARVQAAADLINNNGRPWIAWVGLNIESDALARLVPDAAVVEGSQSPETKADLLHGFAKGKHRVLITKPSIAGFGMNFQHCSDMAFVGLSDSYEQYYQAIRRCWRFGQTRPVDAHVVLSDAEQDIYANVLRKETEAEAMSEGLIANVAQYEKAELEHARREFVYGTDQTEGDGWTLKLGDSCERLSEIETGSVGLSVFSPPFESLYTYSPTERDLGNSASTGEFWTHFSWISEQLLRVLMPGRLAAIHVQQLPTTKTVEGFIGLRDFRGATIQHFIDQGFIYHGEVTIDKDPQAQAIRTKAKSLMFVQLEKDSSWMRPAFGDYIILMRKPGDNPEPIDTDVSRDEWIQWARPIWYNIRETNTLNVAEARSEDDERHIAPLQLETIERCVRLWSNKGDLVLSPFAGIGSEGYEALKHSRRFVGIELKPEYYKVAVKNLTIAEQQRDTGTLLDLIEEDTA